MEDGKDGLPMPEMRANIRRTIQHSSIELEHTSTVYQGELFQIEPNHLLMLLISKFDRSDLFSLLRAICSLSGCERC